MTLNLYHRQEGQQQKLSNQLGWNVPADDHLGRAEQKLHHEQKRVHQKAQGQGPQDLSKDVASDARSHVPDYKGLARLGKG